MFLSGRFDFEENFAKKESRCVTRGDTTYSKLKREPDANIVPRRTCLLEMNIYRNGKKSSNNGEKNRNSIEKSKNKDYF